MTQDFEYKGMVDTGALVDTAVASTSRIGFIGKNGLVHFKRIPVLTCFWGIDYQPRNRTRSTSRLWLWRLSTLFRCLPNLLFNRRWLYECQTLFVLPNSGQGVMDLEFRKKIKTVIYGCDICQIKLPL